MNTPVKIRMNASEDTVVFDINGETHSFDRAKLSNVQRNHLANQVRIIKEREYKNA